MSSRFNFPSFFDAYVQGQQFKQQNQLARLAQQRASVEAQRQDADYDRQERTRNLLANYLTGGADKAAFNELAQVDPNAALQAQQYQRQQLVQQATETYHGTGAVITSKAPAQYARSMFPQAVAAWAAQTGRDPESMTDDEARDEARKIRAQAAAAAGIDPKLKEVDRGDAIDFVDEDTGDVIRTVTKSVTPGEKLSAETTRRGQNMVDARERERLAGAKLSEGSAEKVAQMIANYQQAPFSGYAMGKPANQQIMARVLELNPDYNANEYGSRSKAYKDFATGKPGNAVRSFNVALAHLDTLGNLADALDNHDFTLVNKIAQAFKKQTGGTAPTSFDAAKKIVGDEIVKAVVGSGAGGVADREEVAATIDRANSPSQLKAVIQTYQELMGGQLGGLRQQFEITTGRKDFDSFLSPEALKYVAAHAPAPTEAAPVVQAPALDVPADIAALLKKHGAK